MDLNRDVPPEQVRNLLDSGSQDASEVSLVGNLYLNRRLGLAFTRPPGWVFEGLEEMAEIDQGEVFEADGVAAARSDLDEPATEFRFVALGAPPRQDGVDWIGDQEVRPVITILDEGRCEPNRSMKQVTVDALMVFRKLFTGYRLTMGPVLRDMSGCEAAEYRAEFLYLHKDLPDPVPVRERVIFLAQCPQIYSIRMCDYPAVDERLSFDFDDFVDSIRVA